MTQQSKHAFLFLSCIIPSDGLGVKVETLDFVELIHHSVNDKSID